MVAIPSISNSAPCVKWDSPGLLKGGNNMMSIPNAMLIQTLEINDPPWVTIRFTGPKCSVTPRNWGIGFDLFGNSLFDILVKLLFDLLTPVNR